MSADLIGALAALAVALAALLIALSLNDARREQAAPPPTILYDGRDAAGPLVALGLGLTGRPDQVAQAHDGAVAVILRRAGRAPAVASAADSLQCAAECLAVEEALGVRSARGILRYDDRDLAVISTPALRDLVLRRLGEVRASEARGPVVARQEPAVCRACAYRAMCAIGRANAPTPFATPGG